MCWIADPFPERRGRSPGGIRPCNRHRGGEDIGGRASIRRFGLHDSHPADIDLSCWRAPDFLLHGWPGRQSDGKVTAKQMQTARFLIATIALPGLVALLIAYAKRGLELLDRIVCQVAITISDVQNLAIAGLVIVVAARLALQALSRHPTNTGLLQRIELAMIVWTLLPLAVDLLFPNYRSGCNADGWAPLAGWLALF